MSLIDTVKQFFGKEIEIVIDRPLGSKHPVFDFTYKVNYGYVPGVRMPDGEDLDVYCLGWDEPMDTARGKVIAAVHRFDDEDDKLVVVAPGKNFDLKSIEKSIYFQEKYFRHEIILDIPY